MIIAFSGLAGSGKDTAADRLVAEHGFVKVAFADEMKRTCARIYSKMTRDHLWGPSEMRNSPITDYPRAHGPWVKDAEGANRCACCNVYTLGRRAEEKQCYLTARFALQWLGTEWGRTCYENTWTELTLDIANKLLKMSGILRSVHYSYTPYDGLMMTNVPAGPKPNGVVISDLRWPAGNEGVAIRATGGFLAKMKRGEGLDGAIAAHESEKAMVGIPEEHFDIIIDNREWNHEQLYSYLDQIVWSHAKKRKTNMKPMPEMNDFALRCHVASEKKGWTNLKRTDAQTINLMVSENSEALEDFRNKKGINETYYEAKNDKGEVLHLTREQTGDPGIVGIPKPCGIPIEIADTIIRVGQQCGTHGLDLAEAMDLARGQVKKRTDLNEALADSTMHFSLGWRCSEEYDVDARREFGSMVDCFARSLWSLLFFCESAEIDVWWAVEEKMAYNETREQLHGGKRI